MTHPSVNLAKRSLFCLALPGLLAASLSACQGSSESSVKDHAFGQTRVERSMPLAGCKVDSPDQSGYLQMLFDRITAANPQTFFGVYDPSHFCLNLVRDRVVNASSSPDRGALFVNGGLILSARTDAEVAAILSHELGHVVMQHQAFLDLGSVIRTTPQLRENPKVVAIYQVYQDLMDAASVLNDAVLASVNAYQELREKTLTGSPEIAASYQKAISDALAKRKQEDDAVQMESAAAVKAVENDQSLTKAQQEEKRREIWDDTFTKQAAAAKRFAAAQAAAEDIIIAGNRDALTQFKKASDAAMAQLKATNSKTTKVVKELNTYVRPLAESHVLTATEQEADEVGFEFYMRAGFDPALYEGMYLSPMMTDGGQDQQCGDKVEKVRLGMDAGKEPERFMQDEHPRSCWRAWDITKNEMGGRNHDKYAAILRQLFESGQEPIAILKEGALTRLQEALRRELEAADSAPAGN